MSLGDKVSETKRKPFDRNPFKDVERIENLWNMSNDGVATAAAFAKLGSDMATGTASFLLGLMGDSKGARDAQRILSHHDKFADDIYTAATEVAKPVVDRPMAFDMKTVGEEERVKLKRLKLKGTSYKDNNGKPPLLITLPIMRGPNLIGSQSQTNPDEINSLGKGGLKFGFDVYLSDWKNPEGNRVHDGMREYLDSAHFLTGKTADITKQTPHGVHICQFGYMALLALGEKPDSMFPNVLAGTPVDMSHGYLPKFARDLDMDGVHSAMRDNGWVVRGEDLIRSWKYGRKEDREAAGREFYTTFDKVKNGTYDKDKVERFKNFLNADDRDIAGDFELDILSIFREDLLMKPKAILDIDISKYKNCLALVTGGGDFISEEQSCLGAFDVVGTPKKYQKHFHDPDLGHSGIYISKLEKNWINGIFPWMMKVRHKAERIALSYKK